MNFSAFVIAAGIDFMCILRYVDKRKKRFYEYCQKNIAW